MKIILLFTLFLCIVGEDEVNSTISEDKLSSPEDEKDNYLYDMLFVGGIAMALWSSVISSIISGFWTLFQSFKEMVWMKIEISEEDISIFDCVKNKILALSEFQNKKFRKSMKVKFSDSSENTISYNPSYEVTYRFTYEGKWIWLTMKRVENKSGSTQPKKDLIELSCFWNGKILENFIFSAKEDCDNKKNKSVIINRNIPNNTYSYWQKLLPKTPRPINSMFLPQGQMEKIISDMKNFIENKDWYLQRGVPYRRGYLFYGPPGTGKSSLIYSIAGHLHSQICVMNLNKIGMNDDSLETLLLTAPYNSMIVFEDIDGVFGNRGESKEEKSEEENKTKISSLTFSGLINSLDGIIGQEGKMIIMTTNHIEKLDPALIRPGRIDFTCQIGLADEDSIVRFFNKFYEGVKNEGELEKLGNEFSKLVSSGKFSIAEIQNHLMFHKENPEDAIKNIEKLVNKI